MLYNDKSNNCVCEQILSYMTLEEVMSMSISEWIELIDMYRVDNDC